MLFSRMWLVTNAESWYLSFWDHSSGNETDKQNSPPYCGKGALNGLGVTELQLNICKYVRDPDLSVLGCLTGKRDKMSKIVSAESVCFPKHWENTACSEQSCSSSNNAVSIALVAQISLLPVWVFPSLTILGNPTAGSCSSKGVKVQNLSGMKKFILWLW